MNHAARMKAVGTGRVRNACSTMRELFSREGRSTWAPTLDRKTSLPGRAAEIAALAAAMTLRMAGKPGAGS